MGKINLTVSAGNLSKEIKLETPLKQEKEDAAIIAALEEVGTVKDDGYATVIEELKAEQLTELGEKDKEIKALRDPIIAGIVADRTRQISNLDAEKEVAFYKDMSTERLLIESAHWSDQAPTKPITTPEEGELNTEDDVI